MSVRYIFSFHRVNMPIVYMVAEVFLSGYAVAVEADYSDIETVEVVGQSIVKQGTGTGSIASLELDIQTQTLPVVLPDILAFAPSANIRTNSRGETLVSIRGSGERQFAVFFDGASVNVPWDNRIDLGLVPVAGVSRVDVTSGPAAIQYGSGTAGGVVEIIPASTSQRILTLEAGSGNIRQASGVLGLGEGRTRLLLAAGHTDRDGITASKNVREEFTPDNSNLITNTDRKQTNALARVVHENESGNGIAASILYNDATYGIAPEQGQNFSDDDARFWRFPKSTYSLLTINGRLNLSDQIHTDISLWHQSFDQDIQSFTDRTYSAIQNIQQDRNKTVGSRAVIAHETQAGRFTVNGSALWSRHREIESQTGLLPRQSETFTHQTFSFGADYVRFISSNLSAKLGAGYEVFEPLQTAGRLSERHFSGVNAVAEVQYVVDEAWQLRFSAGRRVRLPTMRELFGDAIGRFILNSELTPEVTWQYEVEARYQAGNTDIKIIPFASLTDHTLDQRRVLVDGDLLRQRFNLNGSNTYGIEVQGLTQISDDFTVDGNVTWNTHVVQRELVDNSSRRLYLSDRPNWLAHLNALYQLGAQTTLGINVVYRGEARSQDGSGNFQRVDPATQVHVAFTHRLNGAPGENDVSLYIRADNVTDAFVEPQLGLPDPGRTIRFGLMVSL